MLKLRVCYSCYVVQKSRICCSRHYSRKMTPLSARAIGFHQHRRPLCCSSRCISSPRDSLALQAFKSTFICPCSPSPILSHGSPPMYRCRWLLILPFCSCYFVGRCSSPRRRAASIVHRLLVLVISCMHPMEKGRRNHSCSGTRGAIIHPKTSRI